MELKNIFVYAALGAVQFQPGLIFGKSSRSKI